MCHSRENELELVVGGGGSGGSYNPNMRFGRPWTLLGFPLLAACVAGNSNDPFSTTVGVIPESAPEEPRGSSRSAYEAAYAVFRTQRYVAAREAFEGVAEQALGTDAASRVEALAMVARCYSLTAELDLGEPWLRAAEQEADRAEPYGWVRTGIVRGIYLRERARTGGGALHPSALAAFTAVYDYALERGLLRDAMDAAHFCAMEGEPGEQIRWAELGLGLAQRLGDDRWQAILWNNLGYSLEQVGDPERVLAAYSKARIFHRRSGGDFEVLVADWAVGHAQRLTGDLQGALVTLQDVEERAQVLAVTDAALYDTWRCYAASELCEVELELGRIDEAEAHLKTAASLMRLPSHRELAARILLARKVVEPTGR